MMNATYDYFADPNSNSSVPPIYKRLFGLPFHFRGKSKSQSIDSELNPIRCVSVQDMKFSTFDSCLPRHYPSVVLQWLPKISVFSAITCVHMHDGSMECTLKCESQQTLSLVSYPLPFQSKVIPFYGNDMIHPMKPFLRHVFPDKSTKRRKSARKKFNPGFQVLLKDALNCTILTMICQPNMEYNMGEDSEQVSVIDEMEVFLGRCNFSIGKIVKVPSPFSSPSLIQYDYKIRNEIGEEVYSIFQVDANALLENSSILTTYRVVNANKTKAQTPLTVGLIKISKRSWVRCLPRCCVGYGPSLVVFLGKVPVFHKALLIGAMFFIAERTTWKMSVQSWKKFQDIQNVQNLGFSLHFQ